MRFLHEFAAAMLTEADEQAEEIKEHVASLFLTTTAHDEIPFDTKNWWRRDRPRGLFRNDVVYELAPESHLTPYKIDCALALMQGRPEPPKPAGAEQILRDRVNTYWAELWSIIWGRDNTIEYRS